MLKLRERLQAEGADAFMVLPPYYLQTGGDGLLHYGGAIGCGGGTDYGHGAGCTADDAGGANGARAGNVRDAKVEAPPTAPKLTEVSKQAGDQAGSRRLFVPALLPMGFELQPGLGGRPGARGRGRLAAMRIASLEAFALRVPRDLPAATGTASSSTALAAGANGYRWSQVDSSPYGTQLATTLVRVTLDSGHTGWGEALAPLAPEVARTSVERLLVPAIAGERFEGTTAAIKRPWWRMYNARRVRGQTGGFSGSSRSVAGSALARAGRIAAAGRHITRG